MKLCYDIRNTSYICSLCRCRRELKEQGQNAFQVLEVLPCQLLQIVDTIVMERDSVLGAAYTDSGFCKIIFKTGENYSPKLVSK